MYPFQCAMLNEKLDSLVRALSEEADAQLVPAGSSLPEPEVESSSPDAPGIPRPFRSKEQLMLRANSLKKALRQIMEQAEKGQCSGCQLFIRDWIIHTTGPFQGIR